MPPESARHESPLEELPTRDLEAREVATLDDDRVHARGLFFNVRDSQLVAKVSHERANDSYAEHGRERHGRYRNPEVRRDWVSYEHHAGLDFVRERQDRREIEIQVHGPPRLVLHVATNRRNRRHR